jgi:hypothetical protein
MSGSAGARSGRRPGKIEIAILTELRAAGGRSSTIGDHGPSTGKAIDRLESKGWVVLVDGGNAWQVAECAP